MKKSLWTKQISEISCPKWSCAYCEDGTLELDKESFRYQETAETSQITRDENFDPTWIKYVFSSWAKCANADCNQHYVLTGDGALESGQIGEAEWGDYNSFNVLFVHPSPHIIKIPQRTPDSLKQELIASFSLFWIDSGACANKIRVAVEELMDQLNVPHKKTLHQRIEEYQKITPQIADKLMAIKWFGNTASHEGRVRNSDLLSAYEIIEYVLEKIYGEIEEQIAEVAAKLHARHAPKKAL